MIGHHRHPRLPVIALAAFVGMMSAGGEASACSGRPASRVTRPCCSARPIPACCCKSLGSEAADLATAPALVSDGLSVLDPPCERRPGVPADSTSKPESLSSERCDDQERTDSVVAAIQVRPAISSVQIIPATDSPPDRPLYLRTSRLLF